MFFFRASVVLENKRCAYKWRGNDCTVTFDGDIDKR